MYHFNASASIYDMIANGFMLSNHHMLWRSQILLTQFMNGNLLLSICLGAILALIVCFAALSRFTFFLPRDHGRAYAVEGGVSRGKPTGAGILFIDVFAFFALLFLPLSLEYALYVLFILLAMLFGYLDDRAEKPWKEYLKGALDLMVSLGTAVTFSIFSSREILFPILGLQYEIPLPLYILLATILIWVSINVTNCTDGVDGLSSSLTIVSIASLLGVMLLVQTWSPWSGAMLIMAAVLIPYLWFNTNPSSVLMGDAGSRALGVFLAISVMQSRVPLSYLALCLVFILDGSSGIIKISLKRFLRISVLKNTLTPLHDHLRKKMNWPNQQVTIRVAIFQTLISILYLAFVYFSRAR